MVKVIEREVDGMLKFKITTVGTSEGLILNKEATSTVAAP